ncbi:MAG TPA: cytochrome c3 family protein [Burkholderiaceae bacterium]|jgi:hypothetical protein|nr:cytochrome c3 family protein [Burkholderiaceae bacterium]
MQLRRIGLGVAVMALLGAVLLLPSGVQAAPSKSAELTPEQTAALTRIGNSTQGIARTHLDKLKLECKACHGNRVTPTDNETTENAACVACHGDYDKLGPQTAAKLKNKFINVHASHLGPEIACTVCHSAHSESKAYCVNCHTNFVMPMPGNSKK